MGSLELVVICDEIISWLKASMQGLEINEETLALDVIHEHALSGDFLGADHTRRHVREDWQPRLVDRHNYEQWMARGGMSMRERARTEDRRDSWFRAPADIASRCQEEDWDND